MQDKYSAVWVSHTSISDFVTCPRAYFLKHVYKDPATNHKIKLMTPPLALGQAVHEVLDQLSKIPTSERFTTSLIDRFQIAWAKVSGEQGGFFNEEHETDSKKRGIAMLEHATKNPGPLARLAVKIKMDLPYYWLSDEDNIILCGKVDWLEYIPDSQGVHIWDFKTGKHDEDPDSLQLPIYQLLVANCQSYPAEKAWYWYLDREDGVVEKQLVDIIEAEEKVLKIAKQMKLARQLKLFKCKQGESGCFHCGPYEAIVNGEAKLIGQDEYGTDVYVMEKKEAEERANEVEIL